jgi:hypothetical protein
LRAHQWDSLAFEHEAPLEDLTVKKISSEQPLLAEKLERGQTDSSVCLLHGALILTGLG